MSWREERDALIAQTLAFVQSVTGQPADFSQLPLPASAGSMPAASDTHPAAVPAEPTGAAALVDAVTFQVMRAEAAMIDAAMRLVSNSPHPTPAIEAETGAASRLAASFALRAPAASPATEAAPAPNGASEIPVDGFSGEHFTSITAELGLQRDMQTEIRARVASFRAHQERFNRERQEYFSSTLAKLRASMNEPPGSKG